MSIILKMLFARWLTVIDVLRQFFSIYTPQPLLSIILPELIEGSSKFSSQIAHVPRIKDPSDYTGSVDLATICLVPTIFQTHLAVNFSCNDLDDTSSLYSSHHYVPLDFPVWRPVAPVEAQAKDDHTQTNMAPYGARGISFCPVLVGIVYVQSLLHLYMLLMIPSIFNHWFENTLIYESLNPSELMDCSWFLHTSLWMVSWHLFRDGVRKAVPCLHRARPVTSKTTYPPVPQIVLIWADGEAVSVNLSEDQPSVDSGLGSCFQAANLEMGDDRDVTHDDDELRELMEYLISASESYTAMQSDMLPTWTPSHQGEHQGGIAEVWNGIELGSLASKSGEDLQILVEIPNEQLPNPPFGAANEHLQPTKKDIDIDILILPIPGPESLITRSECDVDERASEFERMSFREAVVDDIIHDGTNSLGERENSKQDTTAFSSWSLIDEPDPDEPGTFSESASATSSALGSQVIATPVKNVRFAIDDDAASEDRLQASSSVSHIGESTCAWNLKSQLGDDGVPVQVPPLDPSMNEEDKDAVYLEQMAMPVLPAALAEEDDIMHGEHSSPSLTSEPIVNLPLLVMIRKDVRFVEMDPTGLIEEIATRSPLQIPSPIVPAVVINASCPIEREGLNSVPLETEELGQGLPHAGHAFGTSDDKAAISDTLEGVSLGEDRTRPSIGDLGSICCPPVDHEPSNSDTRTPVVALLALKTASEIRIPAASSSLAPNTAIDGLQTNGHGMD
ncbi:hypothetical protein V8E55_007488 [Tylopilus felleus]